MPLKFDDPLAGRSDDEVRDDRGEHLLHATGQCFKLSIALPTLAARVSDTECTVPLSLGLWLCLGMLTLDAAVRSELFHLSLVGPTRLGAVLELVLGDMEIAGPIPATVLRRRLIEQAALRRRSDPTPFTVVAADLYAVGGAGTHPNARPRVSHALVLEIKYEQLLDSAGLASVFADCELVASGRVQLAVRQTGNPLALLSKIMVGCFTTDEFNLISAGADAADLAAQATHALGRYLPVATELADYHTRPADAALTFVRLIARARLGTNASTLIPVELLGLALHHFPGCRAVVGSTGTDASAADLVTELCRLVVGTTNITLSTLARVDASIGYLLPRLESADAAPAGERLQMVADEFRTRELTTAAPGNGERDEAPAPKMPVISGYPKEHSDRLRAHLVSIESTY